MLYLFYFILLNLNSLSLNWVFTEPQQTYLMYLSHHIIQYCFAVNTCSNQGVQNSRRRPTHKYTTNSHWRSYEDLCHPCFVGYDFIGKYETLSDDVEHVMKLAGIHGLARFPASSKSRQSRRINSFKANALPKQSTVRGYEHVPLSDVKRLIQIYDDDYALFEYAHPVWLTRLINHDATWAGHTDASVRYSSSNLCFFFRVVDQADMRCHQE